MSLRKTNPTSVCCTEVQGECEPPGLPLAGIKILLTEDEPDMAVLFCYILKAAGAEVSWSIDAPTTLQQLQEQAPHLLLCDLHLPGGDGLGLIAEIRRQGFSAQSLPAIAISSWSREYNAQQVLSAGFQAYLPKPCDPDGLIAAIRLYLDSP